MARFKQNKRGAPRSRSGRARAVATDDVTQQRDAGSRPIIHESVIQATEAVARNPAKTSPSSRLSLSDMETAADQRRAGERDADEKPPCQRPISKRKPAKSRARMRTAAPSPPRTRRAATTGTRTSANPQPHTKALSSKRRTKSQRSSSPSIHHDGGVPLASAVNGNNKRSNSVSRSSKKKRAKIAKTRVPIAACADTGVADESTDRVVTPTIFEGDGPTSRAASADRRSLQRSPTPRSTSPLRLPGPQEEAQPPPPPAAHRKRPASNIASHQLTEREQLRTILQNQPSVTFHVTPEMPYLAWMEGYIPSDDVHQPPDHGKPKSSRLWDVWRRLSHTRSDKDDDDLMDTLFPAAAFSVEMPPDKALCGAWTISLHADDDKRRDFETPVQRFCVRHERYQHLGPDLLACSDLSIQCFEPSRQRSFALHDAQTSDKTYSDADDSIKIGALSILAFAGTMSQLNGAEHRQWRNDRNSDIVMSIVCGVGNERCDSDKRCLFPVFEYAEDDIEPIKRGPELERCTDEVRTECTGASFLCDLPSNKDYQIWIAQDETAKSCADDLVAPIVAFDVIFPSSQSSWGTKASAYKSCDAIQQLSPSPMLTHELLKQHHKSFGDCDIAARSARRLLRAMVVEQCYDIVKKAVADERSLMESHEQQLHDFGKRGSSNGPPQDQAASPTPPRSWIHNVCDTVRSMQDAANPSRRPLNVSVNSRDGEQKMQAKRHRTDATTEADDQSADRDETMNPNTAASGGDGPSYSLLDHPPDVDTSIDDDTASAACANDADNGQPKYVPPNTQPSGQRINGLQAPVPVSTLMQVGNLELQGPIAPLDLFAPITPHTCNMKINASGNGQEHHRPPFVPVDCGSLARGWQHRDCNDDPNGHASIPTAPKRAMESTHDANSTSSGGVRTVRHAVDSPQVPTANDKMVSASQSTPENPSPFTYAKITPPQEPSQANAESFEHENENDQYPPLRPVPRRLYAQASTPTATATTVLPAEQARNNRPRRSVPVCGNQYLRGTGHHRQASRSGRSKRVVRSLAVEMLGSDRSSSNDNSSTIDSLDLECRRLSRMRARILRHHHGSLEEQRALVPRNVGIAETSTPVDDSCDEASSVTAHETTRGIKRPMAGNHNGVNVDIDGSDGHQGDAIGTDAVSVDANCHADEHPSCDLCAGECDCHFDEQEPQPLIEHITMLAAMDDSSMPTSSSQGQDPLLSQCEERGEATRMDAVGTETFQLVGPGDADRSFSSTDSLAREASAPIVEEIALEMTVPPRSGTSQPSPLVFHLHLSKVTFILLALLIPVVDHLGNHPYEHAHSGTSRLTPGDTQLNPTGMVWSRVAQEDGHMLQDETQKELDPKVTIVWL